MAVDRSNRLLAERHATRLVYEFLVMKHRLVPGDLEKSQNLFHPVARMKHQLFVGHHKASIETDLFALFVHRRYRVIPLCQALPVWCQIEARYGDL